MEQSIDLTEVFQITFQIPDHSVLPFECLIQLRYGLLVKLVSVNEEQDALGDAGLQIKAANCTCHGSLAGSSCYFQEEALTSRFGGFLHGFDGPHLVIPHSPRPQETFAHRRIPQRSTVF